MLIVSENPDKKNSQDLKIFDLGLNESGYRVFQSKELIVPPDFRLATESDVIGLNIYKKRRENINNARNKRIEQGVVDSPLGPFDSHQKSTQRIMGAAILAGFGALLGLVPVLLELSNDEQKQSINTAMQGFKTDWINADNEVVKDIDLAGILQIGGALAFNESAEVFSAKNEKDLIATEVFEQFNQ